MPRGPRYVCIHGHFYQPPRENAWLEAIEIQDSAAPFHDWNARIEAECYAPNARARILGEGDRITRIVNNYERISFNFGPTLLSWMERRDPATYAAILAADREAARRFGGHGSALAQAYNHAILPLCDSRDRRTQVLWGLADFRKRFGREAAGMWLPETAADTATLEVLAAEGVGFTILAPRQAAAVRRDRQRTFVPCEKRAIDPRRAYRMRLPSGREIALFFYDGPISQAIAFERLLDSGAEFTTRLVGAFDERDRRAQLVHVATDGETYGHHHRFGEMALAFALQAIDDGNAAELINYGRFLELHPPRDEVRIVEPSSWSCEHGVGRWSRDCGCHTGYDGSWNQAWREPLRAALDGLRDDLAPVYETHAKALFHDPWKARDAYVDVVLDPSPAARRSFFSTHAKRELDPDEITRALRLLELQRHAMLMFTSCAWFFDEVSGIETVQVLQYAARALELAEGLASPAVRTRFLERLARARSNLPQHGDARRLFETRVATARAGLREVALNHTASLLYDGGPEAFEMSAFRVDDGDLTVSRAEQRVVLGSLEVLSLLTLERATFCCFAVVGPTVTGLVGGIRPAGERERDRAALAALAAAARREDPAPLAEEVRRHFGSPVFGLRDLFRDPQRQLVRRMLEVTLAEVGVLYKRLYDEHAGLMTLLSGLETHAPRALRIAAEWAGQQRVLEALADPLPDPERLAEALAQATTRGVGLDAGAVGYAAQEALVRVVRHALTPGNENHAAAAVRMVEVLRSLPFHVDLRPAQDALYHRLRSPQPPRALAALGDALGIAIPGSD